MLPLLGPSSSKAVVWRTWGLGLAFPDRQYLLVWVQRPAFLLLLLCFCVSDLTSTRKFVLCSFHRRLKHQHCVCSYVTEWQLLWRKWSCASGRLCLWQEKKSLHKVLILISTFLFFTFIGRSCQSLLSILSSKPSNIKYDQYVLTYF